MACADCDNDTADRGGNSTASEAMRHGGSPSPVIVRDVAFAQRSALCPCCCTYSGGSSRGRRSGPTATYVRLASVTLTQTTSVGFRCAYTSTPTVIEVRPTFVTSA